MRRNKIRNGWNAVPTRKRKFEKAKISWSSKYEFKHLKEDNIISKIIRSIIKISLLFTLDKKNFSKTKRSVAVNNTYEILSSSKFKFIPSSVAFYLLLSIIPIAIIVFSIVSLLNVEWNNFLIGSILYKFIPGSQDIFTSSIDFKKANFWFVFLFLFSSIWFASKGIVKLRDSFTELYGYEDNQNFLIKRFKGILTVILVSLYFSIMSLAFIPLMHFISTHIKNYAFYEFLFYLVSFVYILFFGYLGIGLLFKYISPIKLKWEHINYGILTSLVPIILFLFLFSTIAKLLNYEKFGAVGSFLYLVMFILYISYFLHAGIIVNSSYYKANVFQNIVVRRSFIFRRILNLFKNIWFKIKFNKRN